MPDLLTTIYTLRVQSRGWLTASEAALRLGLTSQSVRNLVRRGRLRSERTASGLFLVAADDVANYRGGVDEPSWPAVLVKNRVWNQLDGWDGAEVGGWLIGRLLDSRVVVEAVSEEATAVRSSNSIALDLRRIPAIERAQAQGVTVVGDFHGHPSWGSEFASGRDHEAWAAAAATLRQTWLGLVVREGRSPGQIEPDVTGYLTRADGTGKWITPVRI